VETLTIKRGDKHDVKLLIVNAPITLTGGTTKVFVTPSIGGTAQQFNASLSGDIVTWTLDGTLTVGKYKLEVQVTVSGLIVTAPNDGWLELVVLQDLA
jgi:hypothetical protein